MKRTTSQAPLNTLLSIKIVLFIFAVATAIVALGVATVAGNHENALKRTTYQEQLLSKVSTADGSPRSGRDPASQQQTSLTSVASKPAGNGQRVDNPAAKVTGGKKRVNPSSVLPDTKKTGVLASGCLLDYGTPGEQCIPASTAKNKAALCKNIEVLFKNGVQITGKDRLGFDRNKDKVISATDC